MPENRKKITKSGGNMAKLLDSVRLITRLMADNRVSPLVKLLPIGALIYLISPIDGLPGPIDDTAILFLGGTMFIEMCPPHVVQEHLDAIDNVFRAQAHDVDDQNNEEEVIDVDARDIS